MLEKFKFWKHKEPELPDNLPPIPGAPDLPAEMPPIGAPAPPAGIPAAPGIPAGPPMEPTPSPAFQQMEQMSGSAQEKDMQLIAAKLDVLKAQLDNITQRLDRLESLAQESGKVRW